MKGKRTKKQSEKATQNDPLTTEQQQTTVNGPLDDLLIEPVERLKRLHGAVSLLAALGSSERAGFDIEHVLRFCELVEDQLESAIDHLVSVQKALASVTQGRDYGNTANQTNQRARVEEAIHIPGRSRKRCAVATEQGGPPWRKN